MPEKHTETSDNGHAQTQRYVAERRDWREKYREEMERVRRPRRRADRGGRGGPVQIGDLLPEELLKDIEAAKRRRKTEGG